MSDSAQPGWYHAEGDPPNTERYWDGTAWTEGPRPVGGTPPVSDTPSDATFGGALSGPLPSSGDLGASTPPTAGTPSDFSAPQQPAGGFGQPGQVPGQFPGAAPGGVGGLGTIYPEKSNATTALVLSILGFFCCVTAPIGAYLGYQEKNAIDEGKRDPSKRGQAVAAMVIGLIFFALSLLGILFIFAVGFVGASAPVQ